MSEKGFFTYSLNEGSAIIDDFKRSGWVIFELPRGISSKDDFFDGVRKVLPLDPPVAGNQSWDALSDSMWSGLDGLEENKILIVWPDALEMSAKASEDAVIASEILSELPISLADATVTAGLVKEVAVIKMI